MGWCTVNGDMKKYIAIGGYSGNSEEHHTLEEDISQLSPGDADDIRNCIQIWSFEVSKDEDNSKKLESRLELVLLYERSAIYDINWVSNQGYMKSPPECGDHLKILGLLAASFGDGSFSVICVPHPSSLRESLRLEENSVVYLRQRQPLLDARIPNTKLWRLGWDRNNIIVTGCSNGWSIPLCKSIGHSSNTKSSTPRFYSFLGHRSSDGKGRQGPRNT